MAQHPSANTPAGNLQSGARLALLGLVANFVLASVKIIAGLLGNSFVLIADGIESALDIAGSAIIWGGLKLAARPPDATHPYGHGKAEPVAAIVVSLGVLAAAFGLAFQSAHEIFVPHHAPRPFTLVVLIAVVIVKEMLYRSVIRIGQNVESTAMQTDAWHHRTDALTSIAAFIGISIALIGGPAWQSADAWAALFACALIGANGYRLLNPALHEMHGYCAARRNRSRDSDGRRFSSRRARTSRNAWCERWGWSSTSTCTLAWMRRSPSAPAIPSRTK